MRQLQVLVVYQALAEIPVGRRQQQHGTLVVLLRKVSAEAFATGRGMQAHFEHVCKDMWKTMELAFAKDWLARYVEEECRAV